MVPYLKKRGTKKGNSWYYDPPTEYITIGLVKAKGFSDGRAAVAYAKKANKVINNYRKGKVTAPCLINNPNVTQLVAHYMDTNHFKSLSTSTQRVYEYNFGKIEETCGNVRVSKLDSKKCSSYYNSWVKDGVSAAAMRARCFSILMTHAMSLDLIQRNPMAVVKKVKEEPKQDIWTEEQLFKFVETAFTKYEWKPVGLLALLAYEWGQRPVDIRLLEWSNIDFTSSVVTIKQKKRGATVKLPISDSVMSVLLQQKEDSKSQYVLPYFRESDGAWVPLSASVISALKSEVLDAAGLPTDLQIGTLRRTAIMEMVEGGADATNIMSVSGHVNLTSLSPYMKHTLESATTALNTRRKT